MIDINAMWSSLAFMAFVYGASATPADPTITKRASLGSIEARANSGFIGWIYDPVYSIYEQESCYTSDFWQVSGNYGGCCTTTASILGCALPLSCTSGSIRVGATAQYECPATAPICATDLVINSLGGKTTTTNIICNSVSTGYIYYLTPPSLTVSSTSKSLSSTSSTPSPTSTTVTSSSKISPTSTSSSSPTPTPTTFSVPVTPTHTTSGTPTPTIVPGPGPQKATIIGASIGAIAGVGFLAALISFIFFRRRKNKNNPDQPEAAAQYQPSPKPPQPPQQQQYYPPAQYQPPPQQQQQYYPPQQAQQQYYPPPQPQSPPPHHSGYYTQTLSPIYSDTEAKEVVSPQFPVQEPRGGAVEIGHGR